MAEAAKRIEFQTKSNSSSGSEKDTEGNIFSQLARSRARARMQGPKNSEDRVAEQLAEIEGEIKGVEGADGASISVRPDSSGGAVIDLQTRVRLTPDEIRNRAAQQQSSYTPTDKGTRNAPLQSRRASANFGNSGELARRQQEEMDRSVSTSPQGMPSDEEVNPFPLADEQTPFAREDEPTTDANQDLNQEGATPEIQEEQKMRQDMIRQEQENAKEQAEIKEKRQVEEDTRKRKLRAFQQFQAQMAPIAAEESRRRQLLGIQMQQEKKLKDLKSKRKRIKIELRVAEALKTAIKLTQDVLLWAAEGLLPWFLLIIPLILAIICFVFWLLLWPGRLSAIATVAYLKHTLNSIEEDIQKAEQNKQKAVSMIQSMQRTKRTKTPSGGNKWTARVS